MSKKDLAHRIKVQLAECKMPQWKMAKLLKITPAAFSNKMKGKSQFTVLELMYIFKVLKFTDEMILDVMRI